MTSKQGDADCGPDLPPWYERSLTQLEARRERLRLRRQLIEKRRQLAHAEALFRSDLQGDAASLARSFCLQVLKLREREVAAENMPVEDRYRGRFEAVLTLEQVRRMFQEPSSAETLDRRAKTADEYRVGYCYMVGPRHEGVRPPAPPPPSEDPEGPEVVIR